MLRIAPAMAQAIPAEQFVPQPGHLAISVRLIGEDPVLEPIYTITAGDLNENGEVTREFSASGDYASIIVSPDLGQVVFVDPLSLPGSLLIHERSECQFWDDVTLGQYLVSLSSIDVADSLTVGGLIDINGGSCSAGSVDTESVLYITGPLVVRDSLDCVGIDSQNNVTVGGWLNCAGFVLCCGVMFVDGDIQCGPGAIQVYGILSATGSITCEDFIFVAWGGLFADGDLTCRGDCVAGCAINVGGKLDVGGRIVAGVNPGFQVDDDMIRCGELIQGHAVFTGLMSEQEPEDAASRMHGSVPVDHWAYGAMRYLNAEGYLPGASPGLFELPQLTADDQQRLAGQDQAALLRYYEGCGWTPLTRLEFAQFALRLLDEMAAAADPYPVQIALMIEALADEFADELAQMH
ncbi:hypothetical protein JW859_15315 [bacterium]|nr:hypothetical protein [bacterium]